MSKQYATLNFSFDCTLLFCLYTVQSSNNHESNSHDHKSQYNLLSVVLRSMVDWVWLLVGSYQRL